ncbi:MAG: cytochrome c3 family protein, partial [Elusimicrobia bacterium]|nr:cytochrome c3 family protein [Elusimicrobiota bacterium]
CTGCHQVPTRDFKIGSITYNHKSFVARGVACQSCHFDIVQGDGAAPKERCLTCHNVPEILARYKDWKFIHKRHVTDNNIACLHCHEEIRHGFSDDTGALARLGGPPPPQRAKRDAVSIARLPTLAFDCSLCHLDQHKGQLELYSGQTSGLGLPIMPNPMFLARVDCSGCHYDQTKGAASSKGVHGVTFRASRQACVRCHGPRFKGLWESIHQELARTVAAMSANLDIVAKAVAAMPPADTAKRAAAQDAFSRARRLVDFIRDSHGDHNIYLAAVALRRAQRQTELAAQASNTQLNDLSDLPLINQTYCATLCHPKVGVKIPREIEHYKGKVMPHGMHARMLPCGQCHDMGVHRKAPLKPNIDAVCANCHQGSAP